MNELYFVGIAFLVALVAGRLLIPSIIFVSIKRRLFDQPNSRKLHSRQISRLGGISFLPSAIIAFCIALVIMEYVQPMRTAELVCAHIINVGLFVVGLLIIFLIGIIDDLSGMSYRYKFLLQAIATSVIIVPLLYIKNMEGILGIFEFQPYLSIPLTIIGAILLINAYNLIDGVDGLCSGLSIVTIGALSVALMTVDDILLTLLASGMIGVLVSFFFYNVFGRRLKIFMGDTGSLVLGYVICFIALQYVETSYRMGVDNHAIVIAIGCVFVPLFDATRLFIFRMMKGNSPFMPDQNHIHHKFIEIGFSHLQTTFVIIGMQVGFILLNVVLSCYMDVNIIILIDICIGIANNSALNLLIKKGVKLSK